MGIKSHTCLHRCGEIPEMQLIISCKTRQVSMIMISSNYNFRHKNLWAVEKLIVSEYSYIFSQGHWNDFAFGMAIQLKH